MGLVSVAFEMERRISVGDKRPDITLSGMTFADHEGPSGGEPRPMTPEMRRRSLCT